MPSTVSASLRAVPEQIVVREATIPEVGGALSDAHATVERNRKLAEPRLTKELAEVES